MSNIIERRKCEMYLLKNYRNYIPLLSMIMMITFLSFYLRTYMYNWPDWTEMLVIILPFVVVPITNVVSMGVNTHKFQQGKKLYLSILFSYVVQFLPALTLLIGTDDKGMGMIQSYYAFLLVVDAITFVYPWMIYPNRKQ